MCVKLFVPIEGITFPKKYIFDKFVQLLKVTLPILKTDSGIIILVKPEHPTKAPSSI